MVGACPSKCNNTRPRIVLYQKRLSMHVIEVVTSENSGVYTLGGYASCGYMEPIWTW